MQEILGGHQLIKPNIQEMLGGLWISGLNFLQNQNNLRNNRIGAICSLMVESFPTLSTKSLNHLTLQLEDHHQIQFQQFKLCCEQSFEFIQKNRKDNRNVLVHCKLGISRSAAICTYYLMRKQKLSVEEGMEHIRSVRRFIKINKGFEKHLQQLKKQLEQKKQQRDLQSSKFYPKPLL